jgi:DNA-binding SARP family transcriptional activator
VQFGILGPLEVRDGGQQKIELGTPKQRAMLAVLVVAAGEVVSTDRLADLLWDGAPPARAEVSIRSYATNLRRVLDPHRAADAPSSLLVSGGGGYRLRLEDADVDLDARHFELLVADARSARAAGDAGAALGLLDDALALWRGPALADVAGEPFARGEAARLEELRIGAEEERLEALLDLGRHREVVAAVEPLLVLHPAREHLRAIHMSALNRSGRPSEALASYRDLREHLADSAGLDPSPALQALHDAIRSGDDDGAGVPADAADGPPLVGRDAELAVLNEAAASAIAGSGRIVLVAGDAGIGKTRLVDELARRQSDRAVVACGRGVEAGDAPAFWPWAEILRHLADDDRVDLRAALDARTADAAALVPTLADSALPPAPALAPDAARFQRYDAVATLLSRVASQRPLVLVLDDLQWFDAGSLRLLVYLAGLATGAPLLAVATYRPEDAGAAEPRNALAELARSAAVTRVDLAGLRPDAVSRLAGQLATDPSPTRSSPPSWTAPVATRSTSPSCSGPAPAPREPPCRPGSATSSGGDSNGSRRRPPRC